MLMHRVTAAAAAATTTTTHVYNNGSHLNSTFCKHATLYKNIHDVITD